MIGGIDFIVGVMFLSGVLAGLVRGFLGTLIDLVGISVGLTLGSFVYLAPVQLFRHFNLDSPVVRLLCFAFSVSVLTFTTIVLLDMLRKRAEWKHFVDRFGGAALGVLEGLFLASGVLIILSTSASASREISLSPVAEKVLPFLPRVLESTERHGLVLPKMLSLPASYEAELNGQKQQYRFEKVAFSQFEGARCLKCAGKVQFDGYTLCQGTRLVPKFTCKQCGRTSDGCQTYEGFHYLYKVCPVEMAKKGQLFDCANWRNYEWVSPKGSCPVCGKQLELWEWKSPQSYRF
ncbi:MAG: CvpA family protein [Candidatus Omnitrophica bacterium]|nr:CvpA family protein [Candidatus Omnitrophota bacterium]